VGKKEKEVITDTLRSISKQSGETLNNLNTVASYNTRPGKEVGLFYNAPEPCGIINAECYYYTT